MTGEAASAPKQLTRVPECIASADSCQERTGFQHLFGFWKFFRTYVISTAFCGLAIFDSTQASIWRVPGEGRKELLRSTNILQNKKPHRLRKRNGWGLYVYQQKLSS